MLPTNLLLTTLNEFHFQLKAQIVFSACANDLGLRVAQTTPNHNSGPMRQELQSFGSPSLSEPTFYPSCNQFSPLRKRRALHSWPRVPLQAHGAKTRSRRTRPIAREARTLSGHPPEMSLGFKLAPTLPSHLLSRHVL